MKKFLLGVTLLMALCLSSCYNDNEEITETTVPTEATTAAVTTVSETTTVEETTTEYNENDYEQGLVFFVQPIIEQYDEYDERSLAEWECRDTEVMRGDHFDDTRKYRKELIFAFSNYTDKPVTIDSIQIIREPDREPISFANGSDTLNIDFTVQPLHKTDYLLQAEDFDYSACESGIYEVVIKVGTDIHGMNIFIDNSELYEETFTKIFEESWGGDIGFAPTFLTEEQQKVFAKACARMYEFFWFDGYLPAEYAETHTADDFIGLFTDVFTEECVRRLAQESYIDEIGNLQAGGFGRGSDITYEGHCFLPVSDDNDQVAFKAVVIHAHGDNPYEVWFEEKDYHIVNTENGWRVDKFSLWN